MYSTSTRTGFILNEDKSGCFWNIFYPTIDVWEILIDLIIIEEEKQNMEGFLAPERPTDKK